MQYIIAERRSREEFEHGMDKSDVTIVYFKQTEQKFNSFTHEEVK